MNTVEELFASGRLAVEEKHRAHLDDQRVLSVTVVRLAPGVVEPPHTHPGFEVLYGLDGRGHVELDGRPTPLSTGQVVHVPEGTVKAIANDGHEPLTALAVLVLDSTRPPFLPATTWRP
jgi:quercetin dioxygenase-like cupin family protein